MFDPAEHGPKIQRDTRHRIPVKDTVNEYLSRADWRVQANAN